MKKNLTKFQQPSSLLLSREQENHQLQKDQPSRNINQFSSIQLSHNIIPLNATTPSISNNDNRENQNYLSLLNYDEFPPSYDEVINN